MKTGYLFILIGIIVAIGVIMYVLSGSAKYANFNTATHSPKKSFHVIGTVDFTKPVKYQPHKNANVFTFYMKDEQGVMKKVYLNKAKPQDFDRSEQVVVIGSIKNGAFYATDILTKCPSKYNTATQKVQTVQR